MKSATIIIASIFLVSCKPVNEFQFNQRVRITEGFYKGCTGTIVDRSKSIFDVVTYELKVDASCAIGNKISAAPEKLEAIDNEGQQCNPY